MVHYVYLVDNAELKEKNAAKNEISKAAILRVTHGR